MDSPKERLTVQVKPEREKLVRLCYERLGYRPATVKRDEHADTQLEFVLEDAASCDPQRMERCEAILGKLTEIDRQVTYYFLKLDCLVGLVGAACLGLSVVALRAGVHWLFTVLLIAGLFGCTITLYLRPVFTRMGMKKHGGEEPAMLAELLALLNEGGETA